MKFEPTLPDLRNKIVFVSVLYAQITAQLDELKFKSMKINILYFIKIN